MHGVLSLDPQEMLAAGAWCELPLSVSLFIKLFVPVS